MVILICYYYIPIPLYLTVTVTATQILTSVLNERFPRGYRTETNGKSMRKLANSGSSGNEPLKQCVHVLHVS